MQWIEAVYVYMYIYLCIAQNDRNCNVVVDLSMYTVQSMIMNKEYDVVQYGSMTLVQVCCAGTTSTQRCYCTVGQLLG